MKLIINPKNLIIFILEITKIYIKNQNILMSLFIFAKAKHFFFAKLNQISLRLN